MNIQPTASRIAGMLSRYGVVGVSCAALNVAIVWVGTEVIGLAYPLATALTCPITIPISYELHRRVSFDVQRRATLREFVRFVLAQLSQFALGFAAMAAVVEWAHWPAWIALGAVSLVMMGYGFLASFSWVFRVRPARSLKAPMPDRLKNSFRLFQTSAFFPAHGGGIEVVAGELARQLVRAGVEVTWMAGGTGTERPSAEQFAGVVIDQASSFDLLEGRIGLPAPVWSPTSLARLWRHIGACDVVHAHDYLYMPMLAAILIARLRGRPIVLTQHVGDIAYESRAARGLLKMLNRVVGRAALGAVAQVVFVGRPVQSCFERFVRFRQQSILIPNGVDQALYRPAIPRSSTEHADSPVLRALFVGRFVEKKGLRLLQACMDLPDVRWVFIGRGPMSPEHWHVSDEVLTLRGVQPPLVVADAMRNADVLVLPSHGEGFPLVVQEALACGTPVLVSQEVADAFPRGDPRCVWSVDARGADAAARLRAALARLASDLPTVRAARPLASSLASQWSWERCVAAYLDIYVGLLPRKTCRDLPQANADCGG